MKANARILELIRRKARLSVELQRLDDEIEVLERTTQTEPISGGRRNATAGKMTRTNARTGAGSGVTAGETALTRALVGARRAHNLPSRGSTPRPAI
jgi:hypothetical protein